MLVEPPSSAVSSLLGFVAGRPCLSGEGMGSCLIQLSGAGATSALPSPARWMPQNPSSLGAAGLEALTWSALTWFALTWSTKMVGTTVAGKGDNGEPLGGPFCVGVSPAFFSLYQWDGRTIRTATVSPEMARFCASPWKAAIKTV